MSSRGTARVGGTRASGAVQRAKGCLEIPAKVASPASSVGSRWSRRPWTSARALGRRARRGGRADGRAVREGGPAEPATTSWLGSPAPSPQARERAGPRSRRAARRSREREPELLELRESATRKLPNTMTMMAAAALICRAVRAMAVVTDAALSPVRSHSSCMRGTREHRVVHRESEQQREQGDRKVGLEGCRRC